jgi:hypothetical protein
MVAVDFTPWAAIPLIQTRRVATIEESDRRNATGVFLFSVSGRKNVRLPSLVTLGPAQSIMSLRLTSYTIISSVPPVYPSLQLFGRTLQSSLYL